MVFITKYVFFPPLSRSTQTCEAGARRAAAALGLVSMQRRKVMMSCWRRCRGRTCLSLFVLREEVGPPHIHYADCYKVLAFNLLDAGRAALEEVTRACIH